MQDSSKPSTCVDRIERFNADRAPDRVALKYQAMRGDPFVFFRGTAHVFWEDWPGGELDDAPLGWACGDLHLENFGSYRGDNRLAYFDMNDFDEAALAPVTCEVARFLTSVHLAAKSLRLAAADTTELCHVFLDAYAAALADGKARWVERATATGMVKELLRGVRRRSREELLDARTVRSGGRGRRRIRIDGARAFAVPAAEHAVVAECIHAYVEAHADLKREPRFYNVLDVAGRIAGTGSLGVRRYIVLVRGKGTPDGNYLLDVKEAKPSTLAPRFASAQPSWRTDAECVVTIQHRMQAISPALLDAVALGGGHFILRELQPTEDRLALGHWHGKLGRLRKVMVTMGHVVAWGQLRSSGRQGSATADDLIAFAGARRGRPVWHKRLVAYAADYARRAERDWKEFVKARSG